MHMVYSLENLGQWQFYKHAWKTATDKESLMIRAEINFLTEAIETNRTQDYDFENLMQQIDLMIEKAQQKEEAKQEKHLQTG